MKLCLTLAAAVCLLAQPPSPLPHARAADVPPTTADRAAARALYLVEVNSDDPAFQAAHLVAPLAEELGAEVKPARATPAADASGTITITWRPAVGELAVAFDASSRGVISRVIAAPATAKEAIEAAVLLAGNLARDETSELLGPAPPAVVAEPVGPPIAPTAPVAAPPPSAPQRPFALATFSLVHPLATNANAPDVRTRLNLNLIYGRVGQLEGLQLGGFGLVNDDVRGAQMSFFGNVAGGKVEGFQTAIAFNRSGGRVTGLQAALLNGAGGVTGFQTALFGNWSKASVEGGQFALALNVAEGPLTGVQGSMGVNVTRAKLAGLQAGALNVAGDVQGAQVGFINVAKKVEGLQLGLINVADDVDGVPVGLVSVTKTGGVHPVFWFATETPYNLAIKFSTRFTYTALTASAGKDGDIQQIGPGYLLGVRIPLAPLVFETDVGATYLFGGKACCVSSREGLVDDRLLARWRALVSVSLHRRLSLFVGAGATVAVRFRQGPGAETTSEVAPEFYAGLAL